MGGCPGRRGLEQHQAFRGGSSIRRQEHGGQLTIEETDIYILLKPPFSCMHVSLLLKIYLVMLESYKGAIRELPIGAKALWLRLARSWGAGRVLCAIQVGLTFKLVIIMVRVIIFIMTAKSWIFTRYVILCNPSLEELEGCCWFQCTMQCNGSKKAILNKKP